MLWRLAADRPERSLQSQDMPPLARHTPSNCLRACYLAAWALIAARCVDLCAPLGILFRGEVFQGDGGLFAADGLFRFHRTLFFLVLWL